jgi:tRNA uridine 5-carboxymethylaminomethyl modification enzyme
MGLLTDEHWRAYCDKRDSVINEQERLASLNISPDSDFGKQFSVRLGKALTRNYKASDLLRRPEIDYADLTAIIGKGDKVTETVAEQVEVQAKYSGYLDRQQGEIDKAKRHEQTSIPNITDYANVRGLSAEVRQKLSDHRPETIGQAGRIPGITPAAISLLMVHLKKASK